MSQEDLDIFYIPNWKDYEPSLRIKHQEEGVKLANPILISVSYHRKLISSILEIISQYYTRIGYLNVEDGVVRDADKLWLYTLPHFHIGLTK